MALTSFVRGGLLIWFVQLLRYCSRCHQPSPVVWTGSERWVLVWICRCWISLLPTYISPPAVNSLLSSVTVTSHYCCKMTITISWCARAHRSTLHHASNQIWCAFVISCQCFFSSVGCVCCVLGDLILGVTTLTFWLTHWFGTLGPAPSYPVV